MKRLYFLVIFTIIIFNNCSNTAFSKDPIPAHDTFTIISKQVNEQRIINVWTPEEYKNTNDSFPVMYMADGGIQEDFPHIANTLSKLINENKIPPTILVGIENTQRRRDLTGFTEVASDKEIAPAVGGSDKFRDFIKEELFFEIDNRYRTSNIKSIIGESASGLFVMETFFLSPEMFDNYIAFDPSLWWNNHYLVRTAKEHLASFPTSAKKLWFASSNATDIAPYTKALVDILKSNPVTNLQWNYSNEPKEKHTTIFRATKEKAIIWTIGK